VQVDDRIIDQGNISEKVTFVGEFKGTLESYKQGDALTKMTTKLNYMWISNKLVHDNLINLIDNVYVTSHVVCRQFEQANGANPCDELESVNGLDTKHSAITMLFTMYVILVILMN